MLVLIASYPKSGNTWLRVLLANYFSGSDKPIDINALPSSSILSSRTEFEESIGLDSTIMTLDEIDDLRPAFCRNIAAACSELSFVKVHDAYRDSKRNGPLFPAEAAAHVLYPFRNPYSVCVSYAHHQVKDVDWAISHMADSVATMFSDDTIFNQLNQKILSWSEHISSWLDQKNIPTTPIKYENLLANPKAELENILLALGMEPDERKVESAVEMSDLRLLKEQEAKSGFSEKNPASGSFFRTGTSIDWHDQMSKGQIQRLTDQHESMIKRLGYDGLVDGR